MVKKMKEERKEREKSKTSSTHIKTTSEPFLFLLGVFAPRTEL
jgi:hypothetical protein